MSDRMLAKALHVAIYQTNTFVWKRKEI